MPEGSSQRAGNMASNGTKWYVFNSLLILFLSLAGLTFHITGQPGDCWPFKYTGGWLFTLGNCSTVQVIRVECIKLKTAPLHTEYNPSNKHCAACQDVKCGSFFREKEIVADKLNYLSFNTFTGRVDYWGPICLLLACAEASVKIMYLKARRYDTETVYLCSPFLYEENAREVILPVSIWCFRLAASFEVASGEILQVKSCG